MTDFDIAIALNLRTVLLTTEAAILQLRARGGGALLYTASTSGLVGSAFSPVYSMAKFGVVGFVRSLAKRLAPDKIGSTRSAPARSTRRCCGYLSPAPTSSAPGGGQGGAGRGARPAEPDGPHRQARGDRQRRLFLLSDEASFVSGPPSRSTAPPPREIRRRFAVAALVPM